MNIFEATTICFKKYTNFSDRASRPEYWLFTLAMTLIGLIISIIDPMISGVSWREYEDSFTSLNTIFTIGTFIPSIAVSVRRLHDIGRSGWWFLIALTGIGVILLIVWWIKDTTDEENIYGPNPKAEYT